MITLKGRVLRHSVRYCAKRDAVVGSLQLFDMIMPLTGGGPFNATQTMVTFLYSFGVMRM